MQDVMEKLVELGLKLGAGFIDVRLLDGISTAIRIVDSKLKVGAASNNKGIAIRAFIKGSWGFASSSNLERENLEKMVQNAVTMAKIVAKQSKITFDLADGQSIRKHFPLNVKIKVRDIDISEKVKYLETIDKQAKSFDNRIVNTNASYNDRELVEYICNSNNSFIELHSSNIFVISANYSHEAGVRQRGYRSIGESRGYETIYTDTANNLGTEASKEAIELLSAKSAKGGTFQVLLNPQIGGVFIHEAFGHAAEADAVIAGESILENKIGLKIASDYLNIVDDPTLEGSYGSYRVDDEGRLAERSMLVQNGVLKNYLHTIETSSRLNMKGNNGRTEGFTSYPIVRMSNTHILPGDWKFEEMIEEIKEGIYAQGWIRGYTDPSTGVFMFKCAKANRIKNGELCELIKDTAISGDTLTTLNLIDAIGKDLAFSPGHCGKAGQTVPVSDGAPTIRVKSLVVGGLE